MKEKVIEFIKRRFSIDCNWTCGNCYWLTVILQHRFGGEIYYLPIIGHFIIKIENNYYDWNGIVSEEILLRDNIVSLNYIKENDSLWYKHLMRDCKD